MKRSIAVFAVLVLLSAAAAVCGWAFAENSAGEAVLTETTLEGDIGAAAGLSVSFRADSADSLHWTGSFDFGSMKGETSFKRGEAETEDASPVYDEIRFLGGSTVPFTTLVKDEILGGMQEKSIQRLYDGLRQKVIDGGAGEKGRIRLKEYLDFYPVSFDFQFGTRRYSSDDALTGMKLYEEQGKLSDEKKKIYYSDMEMYAAFNSFFRIPVIENEYQEYELSRVEKTSSAGSGDAAGCDVTIKKPLGDGCDYYEFEPMIVIQEENVLDGKKWLHPGPASDGRENVMKNRMLFAFSNRTAKGQAVDVSQIEGGYGIYELPFEIVSNATIRKTPKSRVVVNPQPLTDRLKMAYPLDEEAEYVEMSMSGDHRYLAVFSVKDGEYLAELVDADSWSSQGPVRLFPTSEKMTYAWGNDGSLVATDHHGHVTVLTRTESGNRAAAPEAPYRVLYSGTPGNGFDEAFFDAEMDDRGNSYGRCGHRADRGLVLAASGDRVAMAQNPLVGGPESGLRNAGLECAVMDGSGVLYRGVIKSNIVDMEYDMTSDEAAALKDMQGGGESGAGSDAAELLIRPARGENRIRWDS